MNTSIEKALHKGLDGVEVPPRLEVQTIEKIREKSKITFFNFRLNRKYVSIAACVVVVVIAFIGVQPYINNNNILPSENGLDQPSVQAPSSTNLDNTGQNSAVYHNIDISQIIRQPYEANVPASYFFQNWLQFVKKNPGVGSHWDNQQFNKDSIESVLHISIISPVLPKGDYTTTQSVLVDDATGEVMAFRTDYYYYNKDTLEFQNRFSVFYFLVDYFNTEELEQVQNVTKPNGQIHIDDFYPSTNVNAKVPHVRKLIYLENSVGIAIEAEADVVTTDGKVDEEKSRERYEETDKQLIGLMKSII